MKLQLPDKSSALNRLSDTPIERKRSIEALSIQLKAF
jgi:hypothetical protein